MKNNFQSAVLSLQYPSPFGDLTIQVSEKGLCGISWLNKNKRSPSTKPSQSNKDLLENHQRSELILKKVKKSLDQYFKGQKFELDFPLDIQGTDFQKKVWLELLNIPYGETCSYKELAHRIQNPKSMQAVGNANSKNPINIIIPCHRVISHNGTLAGYVAGVERKKKLLQLENSHLFF